LGLQGCDGQAGDEQELDALHIQIFGS
jgi:hypothetical protein